MTESYKLIKSNGDEVQFGIGKFRLLSLSGFGNPNIEYTTQKSFFQDGEAVTNFTVSPRNLSFDFLGQDDNLEKRTDYWDMRLEILRFLTPVSGNMSFEVTLDNHKTYRLDNVLPTNGLSMLGNSYNSDRNDGRISEQLNLTAYDPIWKLYPITSTGELTPTQSNNLVFPLTFPISFGSSGVVFNENITYNGTWRSYPKITIDGPYNTLILTNTITGAIIKLLTPISSGEKRVIDLTDPINGFTVTDSNGNSKMSEITIETNFTQFYFKPDVVNNISAVLNGGSQSTTKMTIEYYEKYLGI